MFLPTLNPIPKSDIYRCYSGLKRTPVGRGSGGLRNGVKDRIFSLFLLSSGHCVTGCDVLRVLHWHQGRCWRWWRLSSTFPFSIIKGMFCCSCLHVKGCFVVLVTQRDVSFFLSSRKWMFRCSCPHANGCLVVVVLTLKDVWLFLSSRHIYHCLGEWCCSGPKLTPEWVGWGGGGILSSYCLQGIVSWRVMLFGYLINTRVIGWGGWRKSLKNRFFVVVVLSSGHFVTECDVLRVV